LGRKRRQKGDRPQLLGERRNRPGRSEGSQQKWVVFRYVRELEKMTQRGKLVEKGFEGELKVEGGWVWGGWFCSNLENRGEHLREGKIGDYCNI